MEKVIKKLEDELSFQSRVKLAEKNRITRMKAGIKTEEPYRHDDDYISQLELALTVLKNYGSEHNGQKA